MGLNAKILIVDADKSAVERLHGVLAQVGYQLDMVPDGPQAVKYVEVSPPQLVLLENALPGVPGFEVCAQIKAIAKDNFIPVIMVTSDAHLEAKVTGLKAGADDYLPKSCDALELRARIAALLRIKDSQDRILARRRELEALSVTDELTGLLNHRAMRQRLREEFVRAQRYAESLCVLLIDIDHFQAINEHRGHSAGNQTLAQVGQLLKRSVREVDVVARHGSDEFVIILPQTNFTGALVVAERVRRLCHADSAVTATAGQSITLSLGIGFYPHTNIVTIDDLISRADGGLLQAKQDGRNRISMQQHLNS